MAFPLAGLAGIATNGSVISEVLALGFLAGAVPRLSFGPPTGARLAQPALILGALVVASAVVLLSGAWLTFVSLPSYLGGVARHVAFRFFVDSHDFGDLNLAVQWLEALSLAVAAEAIVRRTPSVGRIAVPLLIVSGGILAFYSANRVVEVAMRSSEPFDTAWRVISTIRLNPFYRDINAAGSMYALLLVPAIGAAVFGRKWVMWVPASMLALACWLAGSRSALIGVAIGCGLTWVMVRPPSKKRNWWAFAAVAILALALLIPSMRNRGAGPLAAGAAFRQEMTRVTLRVAADHPVFGVGLARLRPMSVLYLGKEMEKYLDLRTGENAHNDYLQLLAELGPFATIGMVWMLVIAARRPRGGDSAIAGAPVLHAILFGGVAAFAVSGLGGHPLLTDQIRLTFLLTVGLAAGIGAGGAAAPPGASATPLRRRWATAVSIVVGLIVVFIAASLPSRVMARRNAVTLDGLAIGASEETEGPEGTIYRAVTREATFYFSGTAKAVEVPIRANPASTAACTIRLQIDGRNADVVTATAEAWRLVHVPVFPAAERRSRPLHLDSPEGCLLMVGRLVVHQ
jgi:hypothetical protein